MRRVALSPAATLAPLFERHKVRGFGFLDHLVGDRALPENLVSETFPRFYQARAQYRVQSGFAPWLFAIARKLAIGELDARIDSQQPVLATRPNDVEAQLLRAYRYEATGNAGVTSDW
jgi:DNA-directed RNA polymerase specialized sigma24 family protein